ncbi:GlxA family transcriptional regulator [Ruegeria arenilitoris]|uniref:GlxA family transcriptional regulator n=1 Tax=Ruegeria arenilitoris TaxID=1173585 RepID=UPI00147F668A|nr:helix-turn-helix domain-containing protein [Ruegeria arenilitoris]
MQPSPEPTRFVLVLQPEFPISAVILASEALRIVNQNSGLGLFAWQLVSEDGQDVRASNGMWLQVDSNFDNAASANVVLLFEGNLPTQHISRGLLGYLRGAARFGAVVGGIDTGTYALAHAGLAATEATPEVVLHWEAVPAFSENFPSAQPQNRINQSDGNVVFSAGGTATLDLMLDLIARYAGEAMANEVANAMIHTRREANARQRQERKSEFNSDSLATEIVRIMEENMDFPLSLEELAAKLNTSKRTIARVSENTFQISPMRLYLQIRLQAARNYLFYEEHTINDIATACGFSYPAAFSRAFRSQFDISPSEFRRSFRDRQRLAVQPEIHRLIAKRKSG